MKLLPFAALLFVVSALAAPACAQPAAPRPDRLLTRADALAALIAQAQADLPAAVQQGRPFSGAAILQHGPYRVSLEDRSAQTKPQVSVHKFEAELMIVLEGSGTIIVGGQVTNPRDTNPANQTGDAIVGGTENHLSKGDFLLVPQNTPHEIATDGSFILATMHLPMPPPGP